MPRGARIVIPGLPHHITARGNNRHDVFFTDDDRDFYLALLADNCTRFDLHVEAYCLMTNHVHVIGVPDNHRSLELAIGRTQLKYAIYVNRYHGRSGHLWEDRFYSCPLDSEHRLRATQYVERNPVRSRMVKAAHLYPWSSASAHCGQSAPHRVLGSLQGWFKRHHPDDWQERLGDALPDDLVTAIRRRTFRGQPLGTDHFVAQLEARLNRRLRPNPVGRPRKSAAAE